MSFKLNESSPCLRPVQEYLNTSTQSEVQVYKKRWYVLLIFCINGMMQFAIWNTFSPIETTARAVYKWDGWVIDLIAALGSITFCVSMLPFSWIMDVKGKYMLLQLLKRLLG